MSQIAWILIQTQTKGCCWGWGGGGLFVSKGGNLQSPPPKAHKMSHFYLSVDILLQEGRKPFLRDLIKKIVTPDIRFKARNCNQVEIFVSALISDLYKVVLWDTCYVWGLFATKEPFCSVMAALNLNKREQENCCVALVKHISKLYFSKLRKAVESCMFFMGLWSGW